MIVESALQAAGCLRSDGINIRVVNLSTLRPLDKELIIDCARRSRGIVTCEEHLVGGGLSAAVAEVLAEHCPRPMRMIGIRERFGQSGAPEELIREYGLRSDDIVRECKELLLRLRQS